MKNILAATDVFDKLTAASLTMVSIRVLHIKEEEILNKEQESNKKLFELCFKEVDHSIHWLQKFVEKAKQVRKKWKS